MTTAATLTLTVLCGLPAAGKSTYAAELTARTGAAVVSADRIRNGGDPYAVSSLVYDQARRHLVAGRSVIADVCALRTAARMRLLHIGRGVPGVRCEAVMLCTRASVCRARDTARSDPVGIRYDWHRACQLATETARRLDFEGWDQVTYVPARELAFAYL